MLLTKHENIAVPSNVSGDWDCLPWYPTILIHGNNSLDFFIGLQWI